MAESFRIMAAMALTALAAQGAAAADNPLARGLFAPPAADAPIAGSWNGTDLEKRSACTHPENEGNRGTYAQFDITTNDATGYMVIQQTGITGLQCTYSGIATGTGDARSWTGSYYCSTDGKHGTFTSRSILVTPNALAIHLDAKLDTTETCTIEAVIAGGRIP
jgi:hypothetical protein